MSNACGPYRQMATLGQHMAKSYQIDRNLELGPHLFHYMDEVEVNIASDRFDHVGFMEKIRDRLQTTLDETVDIRAREFLVAAIFSLQKRIDRQQFEASKHARPSMPAS